VLAEVRVQLTNGLYAPRTSRPQCQRRTILPFHPAGISEGDGELTTHLNLLDAAESDATRMEHLGQAVIMYRRLRDAGAFRGDAEFDAIGVRFARLGVVW
jgi:hypothetical protein